MREILFKAKRIDNGEWVEGFVGCKGEETDLEKWYIMQSTFCANPGIGYPFYFTDIEVDPETICQYTGLTDKNGVKIFEGDILSYNGSKETVRYDTSLRIPCFTTGIGSGSSTAPHPYKLSVRHVVVGNIYD